MCQTPLVISGGLCALMTVTGCQSTNPVSYSPLQSLERAIVFQPSLYPHGDWATGAGVQDVWIQSTDSVCLHGWYAPAPNPRAIVLFCHGNGGNITGLRPALRVFRDKLSASVLVFDYRGYGRSSGHPTEPGLYDDARAARRWLAATNGVPEGEIVLVGHSLGGGVATDLAAGDGARGLVLMSTFTTLPDAAESHVPLSALMSLHFDSRAKIGNYHGPLLLTHGDADRVVPFALGLKLFDAANEPKQMVRTPGGGHNDPLSAECVKGLDRFLSELPPPGFPQPRQ